MSALVLHLELDGFDVVGDKEVVRDVSGHKNNGTLVGDIDLVADDIFGACASFDGTSKHHISVDSAPDVKLTGDVTLEAWVYIREERSDWVRVVGKGAKNASRSYGLWYQAKDKTTKWLFQRGDGKTFNNCEFTVKHLTSPFNTWYHLTGVAREKERKAALYLHDLQGRLIEKFEAAPMLSGAAFDNNAPLTIGYAPEILLQHSGRLAHVRLHKEPRSLAQIEDDIGRDRLALAPFRKSHPLDFRLYDDDDQAVLCISDDPTGHNLRLELRNTSMHAIQWHYAHGGTASESNYHVAVRFRPGTLSNSVLETLVDSLKRATIISAIEPHKWDLYFPPHTPAANEAATLYLLYNGPAENLTLGPNDSRSLTLQKMSAAPGSGARGTLVEFLPAQLRYTGDDKTPITGIRTQYVHVTNQVGRKNIPLHVWLTQGNTVLNDGSEGDLTLRISNGSDAHDITLETTSKFVISFDVADDGWGLTDNTHAETVSVKWGEKDLQDVSRGQVGKRTTRAWELTFKDKKVLENRGQRGQPLDITIGNIRTKSSGHANLYVRYEGIPGYQDGQFILTVEKSPLAFRKDGTVALGKAPRANDVATRASTLTINKTIEHDAQFNYSAAPLSIFLPTEKHNGGQVPNGTADILHLVREGVSAIAFGNKVALAIGRYEHEGLNSRTQLDIKLTDGHFATHNCVLSLRSSGCVGIGTTKPEQKLEVMGNKDANRDRRSDAGTIGGFYSKDRRHGIGISSNQIAAIGNGHPERPHQDLFLAPKGDGSVVVEGRLQIGSDFDTDAVARTRNLQLGGVLRGPRNKPVMITCPHITEKAEAPTLLKGQTNVVVFWHNGKHLNWGFMDHEGAYWTSYGS